MLWVNVRHHSVCATVVGGVESLERTAAQTQACEAVPLTVQNLQPWEDGHVQLSQTVITYVQLRHVTQKLRLVRYHTGDLVQTDEMENSPTSLQIHY